MEFTVGALSPEGDDLVISSGGGDALKVKAYVEPDDVVAFIRAAIRPAVIAYGLRLPRILWRRRRARRRQRHDPQP
jgi:hypothetical protein